jgi:hypothetical protein
VDDLLERFKVRLNDLGISIEVKPPLPSRSAVRATTARLTRGRSTQVYTLIYGPAVRQADTARNLGLDLPMLVFTSFVAPKSAESLRRVGVHYLDTAGNAWLEFGEVLIDVRGRPRPPRTDSSRHTTSHNLFSAGRAQVAFALLAWPQLWDVPLRQLAHAAGVSLGQAHDSQALLIRVGYRPGHTSTAQTNLLDHWAASLPAGLGPKIEIATFHGDPRSVQKVNPDDPLFISGEAAVDDKLRPATLHLYVEELDPRLPIVNRWRSDEASNIVVRRKFWHAPDDSDAPLAGLRPAPWPLVHADLVNSNDPRVRNVANEWRERFAGPGRHI